MKGQVKGYIWYDPEAGFYQKGSTSEYDLFYSNSSRKKEVKVLFEITNGTSDKTISTVLENLNEVRKNMRVNRPEGSPTPRSIF